MNEFPTIERSLMIYSAAVKTLESLGYAYKGGEFWVPPVAQTPVEEKKPLSYVIIRKGAELKGIEFMNVSMVFDVPELPQLQDKDKNMIAAFAVTAQRMEDVQIRECSRSTTEQLRTLLRILARGKHVRMEELKPEDTQISIYSSRPISGFGYDLAKGVQVTHVPSGLMYRTDAYRSQHANRHHALRELRIMVHNWRTGKTV